MRESTEPRGDQMRLHDLRGEEPIVSAEVNRVPSRHLRSNRVAWKAVGEIKITFGSYR